MVNKFWAGLPVAVVALLRRRPLLLLCCLSLTCLIALDLCLGALGLLLASLVHSCVCVWLLVFVPFVAWLVFPFPSPPHHFGTFVLLYFPLGVRSSRLVHESCLS